METLERALSRHETVSMTGLSLRVIDKLIESGELPASKIGRRVLIQPRHVRELLEKNTRETTVNRPDEQELAALTVLRAVEHRVNHDGEAMVKTLRGTGRQVSLRLCEAVELLAYLVRLSDPSDRPAEMLAALRERVQSASSD